MVKTPADLPWNAAEQVAAVREEWPSFYVVHSTPWIVLWNGLLKPYCCEYEVQLLYSAVSLPSAGIEARAVHVEVINPLVGRRPAQPDVPIPHIYRNHVLLTRPRLCLHKPNEWNSSMLISRTIIPWTNEWLVAYEGWRATGEWFAGGHNTERNERRSLKSVKRNKHRRSTTGWRK
jgi:hypothetical protein